MSHKKEPTDTSKQPIGTRYLGHVTGYQPIREQYFLIRSVPGEENKIRTGPVDNRCFPPLAQKLSEFPWTFTNVGKVAVQLICSQLVTWDFLPSLRNTNPLYSSLRNTSSLSSQDRVTKEPDQSRDATKQLESTEGESETPGVPVGGAGPGAGGGGTGGGGGTLTAQTSEGNLHQADNVKPSKGRCYHGNVESYVAMSLPEQSPTSIDQLRWLEAIPTMGSRGISKAKSIGRVTTNQNSVSRPRDWSSANQGPVFPDGRVRTCTVQKERQPQIQFKEVTRDNMIACEFITSKAKAIIMQVDPNTPPEEMAENLLEKKHLEEHHKALFIGMFRDVLMKAGVKQTESTESNSSEGEPEEPEKPVVIEKLPSEPVMKQPQQPPTPVEEPPTPQPKEPVPPNSRFTVIPVCV
eukprot:sb/3465242/